MFYPRQSKKLAQIITTIKKKPLSEKQAILPVGKKKNVPPKKVTKPKVAKKLPSNATISPPHHT